MFSLAGSFGPLVAGLIIFAGEISCFEVVGRHLALNWFHLHNGMARLNLGTAVMRAVDSRMLNCLSIR